MKQFISSIAAATLLAAYIPAVNADGNNMKIAYNNGYAVCKESGIIAAIDYEGERLEGIKTYKMEANVPVRIDFQDADVLILWDDIKSMNPLSEKLVINKMQPTEEPSESTEPSMIPEPTEEPSESTEPSMIPEPTEEPSESTEPSMTPKPTENVSDSELLFSEDFEEYEEGEVLSDCKWKHEGANVVSSIIKNTTDSYNETKSIRWYSKGTSGSRRKEFVFLGKTDTGNGEIFEFSADMRVGVTNGNGGGFVIKNSKEDILSVTTSSEAKINANGDLIEMPYVNGTDEESGERKITKWFNVKITIDSSSGKAEIEISLPNNEMLKVNGESMNKWTDVVEVREFDVTGLAVINPKGYFGAVIADNIKAAKSVNPKNSLLKVMELYGEINTDLYENTDRYKNEINNVKNAFNNDTVSKDEIRKIKDNLLSAVLEMHLKQSYDGKRIVVNENPDWLFIKENDYRYNTEDIYTNNLEELNLSGWSSVNLPHTWNAKDGSDGIPGYDRTKAWYRKNIYVPQEYKSKRIYLEFEGSCLKTGLYINGKAIPFAYNDPYSMGEEITYIHRGGYETFRFDITDYVKYGESNIAAVSVDNTATIETIPLGGDYSKEGGLYRDVSLIVTEPIHLDMLDYGSDGVFLKPSKVTEVTDDTNKDFNLLLEAPIVNNSDAVKKIRVEAVLCEPDHFEVPDNEYIRQHLRFNPEEMYTEGGKTIGNFEEKEIELKPGEKYDYKDVIYVASPKLWDGIESPYCYEVKLNIYSNDELSEEITKNVGFRYYYAPKLTDDVNSAGKFYLNGRQYDLRGVGKHQDWGWNEEALGTAVTDKERLADAGTMYEMGINTVRLVHYPHSTREIEIYDKLGIIVWSEMAMTSVICNADAAGYPAFEAVTLEQLKAMIKQKYNNPSVFFWAFSNEVTHEVNDNLKLIQEQEKVFSSAPNLFEKMYSVTKELDDERLTTYAANTIRHKPDLKTDLLAMNIYPYWYNASVSPKKNLTSYFNLQEDENGNKKPMAFGEVGGSGIVGETLEYNSDGSVEFYGTSTAYTTYQAYMHEKILSGIENGTSGVWAVYLWQMFDSANDSSTDVFPGMNIKGLVSNDHVTRKDAYYFYKANWNKFEPFVHIVNAERTQRPSDKTIIRAYSNSEKCQLYINGKKYGEPITDVNDNDAVADGFHIFMWYDVPLETDKENYVEVRGISGDKECCTSLDDNGEVKFTAADVSKLKLSVLDTEKLSLSGTILSLVGGEGNGAMIEDVINRKIVSAADDVTIKVYENNEEIKEGELLIGMIVRVSDLIGNYIDYNVEAQSYNIAEYKNVSASSIESSKNQASMAVDGILSGDASNSWKAKNKTAGEWIMVDLGNTYNLNRADVYLENKDSRVYPFEIQASLDGKNFETIADRSNNNDTAYTKDTIKGRARYIRLLFGVCSYGGSNRVATVREFEVYGWRFVTDKYYIDEDAKTIYLGETDTEHDTNEVFKNLTIDGQASYDFATQEAGRVLSDGDKIIVNEENGSRQEYVLIMGNK